MFNKKIVIVLILFLAGCVTSDKQQIKIIEQRDALIRLAESYLTKDRPTAALRELLKAKRLDPKNPKLYNILGLTYADKGRFDMAESALKKALKFNKSFPDANNNLGTIYLRQKKWDLALEQFNLALDNLLYSTPDIAHYNIGEAFLGKGMHDKAIENFQMAIDFNPALLMAYIKMVKIYTSIGRPDKASAILILAEKAAPDNYGIILLKGRNYQAMGMVKKAKHEFLKVIEMAPDTKEAREAKKLFLSL